MNKTNNKISKLTLKQNEYLRKLCAASAKFMREKGFHPAAHAGPKSKHEVNICKLFSKLFNAGKSYYFKIDWENDI